MGGIFLGLLHIGEYISPATTHNLHFHLQPFCMAASWRLPKSFRNKISTDERRGFDEGRIFRHLRSQCPCQQERGHQAIWPQLGLHIFNIEVKCMSSSKPTLFLIICFMSQGLSSFSFSAGHTRLGVFPPRNLHQLITLVYNNSMVSLNYFIGFLVI